MIWPDRPTWTSGWRASQAPAARAARCLSPAPPSSRAEAGAQTGIDLSLADPAFGFIVGNFLIANNIIDAKLAGALEVGPLTATSIVLAQGAYTFLPSGEMQVSATATWLMDQASESTATAAGDSTWRPQQSTHAVDQQGGRAVVNLQVPAGAGLEASFVVTRGAEADPRVRLGTFALDTGASHLFLGSGAVVPSDANFSITSDGSTYTYLNTGGAGAIAAIAGNATFAWYIPAGLGHMRISRARVGSGRVDRRARV